MSNQTSGSALGARSILNAMSKSLPRPSDGDRPLIKDAYTAVGLFAHACMLAVGFRLKGLGEDHKLETPTETDDITSLPQQWDASSSTAFRYAHSQSSMEYLLKVNRLGGKALIFAVALGDDKTASFEIKVQDYISEGALKELKAGNDSETQVKDVFISAGRIEDLSSLFKINIIQKVAPGLRKGDYEDDAASTRPMRREDEPRQPEHNPETGDRFPQPARPHPFNDPLAAQPRRPVPPGDFPPPDFEDEYEINRPPRGMMPGPDGRHPLNIGERDLYPPGLAPHDPLRMGPGGIGGGGGMHPTFDDPLFGGAGGGGSFDPRAPPGARYDPTGPGDGPPNLRGGPRFPGGPGGGGGGGGGFGGNPFGGFGRGDFI